MTALLIKLLLRWGVPQRFAGLAADAIIVLLVAGAIWWVHHSIWQAGYDARTVEYEKAAEEAEDKAQADSWALVGDINQIDTSVQAGKTATTRLEVKYRDRIVRTAIDVYRDRPDCRVPDGLWRANDEYADQLGAVAKLGVLVLRAPDEAGRR